MYFQADKKMSEPALCEGFGDTSLTVTNRYLMRGGKPLIPVMGEMHYSRVPIHRWRETLVKMKEGGIDVVASYVFWIHHEETCGTFDFSGNRDLRRFVLLCREVGLDFCLRIGPWAHGECRNGGFPDWLLAISGGSLRTEHEPYAFYMRRFLDKVAEQVRGLALFGIQIENEMTDRPGYLEAVRRYVLELGLRAPLFTATAWGNADLPDTLLPVFGGYPEAPWEFHVHVLDPNPNYVFSRQREDGNIGRDLLGARGTAADRYWDKYPFLTCEVGGGNQATYRRRPYITAKDVTSLVITKLGCGVNLLGYYMYTGGCNPIGKTTMQESIATGYPNDCPVITYDFQAPIGDMGQMRPSFYALGYIHEFLHSFGEMLAPMEMYLPDTLPRDLSDTETLRCSVRSDGERAVLFVGNHIREELLPARPDILFTIVLADRTISLTLDIPQDSSFFIPIGWSICGMRTRYLTVQPLSVDEERRRFTALIIPGVKPVLSLDTREELPLHEGVNTVGSIEIVLTMQSVPAPTALHPLTITPLAVRSTYCSSELLFGHLSVKDEPLPDLSRDYAVRWDVEATYLVIRARGNLGGFYMDGTLVSDHYLSGDDWVIDVRGAISGEAILRIQPFREEDRGTLYLEVPFETGDFMPEVFAVYEDSLMLGEREVRYVPRR